MKQIRDFLIITLALISISNHSLAQHNWAAGYQLGFGNSNLPLSNMTDEQNIDMKPMLTNQLLLKKIIHNLDLELGVGITTWKKNFVSSDYTSLASVQSYTTKSSAFNLTLTAKYTFLQKTFWNLYVPFGINSVHYKSSSNFSATMLNYGWLIGESKGTQIGQNVFTGLGLNYILNNRFCLNAQGIVGYKLYNLLQNMDMADNESNNVSYGFQTGIGYRF